MYLLQNYPVLFVLNYWCLIGIHDLVIKSIDCLDLISISLIFNELLNKQCCEDALRKVLGPLNTLPWLSRLNAKAKLQDRNNSNNAEFGWSCYRMPGYDGHRNWALFSTDIQSWSVNHIAVWWTAITLLFFTRRAFTRRLFGRCHVIFSAMSSVEDWDSVICIIGSGDIKSSSASRNLLAPHLRVCHRNGVLALYIQLERVADTASPSLSILQ
jgi:hypothetical protein